MMWYWVVLGCHVFEDLSMTCLNYFIWEVPW